MPGRAVFQRVGSFEMDMLTEDNPIPGPAVGDGLELEYTGSGPSSLLLLENGDYLLLEA